MTMERGVTTMKKLIGILIILIMIVSTCGALADTGFKLAPVKYDGAELAKCAVPKGYEMTSEVRCCDETTCLGYPVRVGAMLTAPEKGTFMMLYAGENYIERKTGPSMFPQIDGTLDKEFVIFMLHYQPAYNFVYERACTMLEAVGVSPSSMSLYEEDLKSFGNMTAARKDYINTNIVPVLTRSGFTVDWVDATANERTFVFDYQGVKYCLCIFAESFGYQMSSKPYNTCYVLWEVPYYYALMCPEALYREIHDTDFRVFRENTGVNDQFIALSDKLTEKIRNTVIASWNMAVARSMAYAETMTALTFSMVESSLGGSYSTADRFSDYIFDQNDYTTEQGDHVKISTSYDYVYQTGSPTVYYTNDASLVPYGATMLSPN